MLDGGVGRRAEWGEWRGLDLGWPRLHPIKWNDVCLSLGYAGPVRRNAHAKGEQGEGRSLLRSQ